MVRRKGVVGWRGRIRCLRQRGEGWATDWLRRGEAHEPPLGGSVSLSLVDPKWMAVQWLGEVWAMGEVRLTLARAKRCVARRQRRWVFGGHRLRSQRCRWAHEVLATRGDRAGGLIPRPQ